MWTIPGFPDDSILLANVTSFDHTSNLNLRFPTIPQRTLPVWIPTFFDTSYWYFSTGWLLILLMFKHLRTVKLNLPSYLQIHFDPHQTAELLLSFLIPFQHSFLHDLELVQDNLWLRKIIEIMIYLTSFSVLFWTFVFGTSMNIFYLTHNNSSLQESIFFHNRFLGRVCQTFRTNRLKE